MMPRIANMNGWGWMHDEREFMNSKKRMAVAMSEKGLT